MIASRASGGLTTRVVVGVALAAVAVAAIWAGGLAFTTLVAAAVLLMSAEWSVMHRIPRGFRLASLVGLAFVGIISVRLSALDALVALGVMAAVLGLFMRGFDRRRAVSIAAGILYCGLPMVALLWLRALPLGLALVAGTFAVVWATDIGAYFAGRAIGGPRFAPTISPNKTWAGVAGGVVAAVAVATVGIAVMHRYLTSGAAVATYLLIAACAAVLALIAVAGDLFESWLKRRAGVKDSGTLLPGHGGVMDRIDGLVPVAVVVAIGVAFAQARASA